MAHSGARSGNAGGEVEGVPPLSQPLVGKRVRARSPERASSARESRHDWRRLRPAEACRERWPSTRWLSECPVLQTPLTERKREAMRGVPFTLAVLAALLAVTSGCSSGQGSPGSALQTYYSHIEEQQYSAACDLLDAGTRRVAESFGGACPVLLQDSYADKDVREPEIDEAQIITEGDVARVPDSAISWAGAPADEPNDVHLVRSDGKWWVALS